ncbi:ribonuclease H-like YkuK family protein [Bacillus suaedaesalsae]|uniref:Ribonuclease H-like YkuK family protein n=1 Tax=Bacillus suaedaesalsae TaxID=2810349 RepID=A0ABS2DJE4_9BACI|nr:ribonuclease H-like YkuK family protein [Bacillus suaedaesalsae]MBM6617623.1 ribonuclease H-like YkuK family protein [Bacillus suaedaesalsae]
MCDPMMFHNVTEENMLFEEVFSRMLRFIEMDPSSSYHLSIGTDSQVHDNKTRFVSAIHLHRKGKGAWGCIRQIIVPRAIKSIREKISLETTYSQELAFMFTNRHMDEITEILLPYSNEGADFQFEIHLDIGKRGMTKELIQEMTSRIYSMGLEPKIKPDSYAASSYANRYTK